MGGFARSREHPTHAVPPGATITERPDLEGGVKSAATSIRGGLKSGEHYRRPVKSWPNRFAIPMIKLSNSQAKQ
jgi:hypothetical protein